MCFSLRQLPTLELETTFSEQVPEVTIVLPVFNQEKRIGETIAGILANAKLFHELIVIDDGSEDSSLIQILETVGKLPRQSNTSLVSARVYSTKVSRFEAYCDYWGIQVAKSKFVIEVQADMRILDLGFDVRLVNALRQNIDLIAVSGRGVERRHPLWIDFQSTLGTDVARSKSLPIYILKRSLILFRDYFQTSKVASSTKIEEACDTNIEEIFPSPERFSVSGNAGFLGWKIGLSQNDYSMYHNRLWIGQTVMRGPLAIDLEKLRKVGAWPIGFFFQGFDEHFMWLQAAAEYNFKVGFHPVAFSAPLEQGSMRQKRSLKSELLIVRNLLRIRRSKGHLNRQLSRLILTAQDGYDEVRELTGLSGD